ncbi:MAG: hypothetical protein LBS84_04730, partial [Clostridiales bacterium]|nr:hypothetical protein [Clostridiales bacterium]
MKNVLSFCVIASMLLGIYPSIVEAESQNSKQLYSAPALEGTIVGAKATQDDYLLEDAFAEELNQLYFARTREETITKFEETSDDADWFKWFNSLTEEEQKSIECRPAHFAVIQRTIYGKDTLWGYKQFPKAYETIVKCSKI